jgi:hypothetical protein
VVHFRISLTVLRSRNSPGFEFQNQRTGPIGFLLLRHIIRNGQEEYVAANLAQNRVSFNNLSEMRQGRTI